MKLNLFLPLVILASTISMSLSQSNKCKVPTCDAVFLVDGTSALGATNFQKLKDYLRSVMKRFTISLAATHVGLVQFTPMARPEFYFKHFSEETRVDQAIMNMPYDPCQSSVNCYGSDDLNMSLPYAAELALTEGAGNRPEIPDVIVVITTGHQNTKSNMSLLNVFRPLSPRLIYVVEVGDVPQFTTLPGANVIQTFHVDDFDRVGETEEGLCNSVRGGVAGLVTGESGTTGPGGGGNGSRGGGNANDGGSNQGNQGQGGNSGSSGSVSGSKGAGSGNSAGSGSGNGSGSTGGGNKAGGGSGDGHSGNGGDGTNAGGGQNGSGNSNNANGTTSGGSSSSGNGGNGANAGGGGGNESKGNSNHVNGTNSGGSSSSGNGGNGANAGGGGGNESKGNSNHANGTNSGGNGTSTGGGGGNESGGGHSNNANGTNSGTGSNGGNGSNGTGSNSDVAGGSASGNSNTNHNGGSGSTNNNGGSEGSGGGGSSSSSNSNSDSSGGTGSGNGNGSGNSKGNQAADVGRNNNSRNGTAGVTVTTATFGGTLLGILILLIVLALIAFLILLYCLYRKMGENKRLQAKIRELKHQVEAKRATVAKGVQVVRGNTAGGAASLSNVRLTNRNGAGNIDYYRAYNDQQRLLGDRRNNSGSGSDDPNHIAGHYHGQTSNANGTQMIDLATAPPGAYWLPPQDVDYSKMDATARGATAVMGPSQHAEGRGMNQNEAAERGGRSEAAAAAMGAAAANTKSTFKKDPTGKGRGGDPRRNSNGVVQGHFRRKRSDESDPQHRRNSLSDGSRSSNLTGAFKRKLYSHSDSQSSEAAEGRENRGGRTLSDPVVVNGRFGRKRTNIHVKKLLPALPPAPPPLPFIDLLFLVDNSGSIGNGNFDRVRTFLKLIAERIDVSEHGSRMACVMFNQEPLLMFGFDKYLSTPYVLGALDRLMYMGGGTYTGRALRFALEIFKTPGTTTSKKSPRPQPAPAGPEKAKPQSEQPPRLNVVVLVSDGVTEDHIEEASENLRSSGVQLAAVSVKGHQQDTLLLVTRDPRSIFRLDDPHLVSEWIEERQKVVQVVRALQPAEQ